jgi:hypothetical protein
LIIIFFFSVCKVFTTIIYFFCNHIFF